MTQPTQVIRIVVDGYVAGAVVLFETKYENRLSAVNFNGTEIRSFDLRNYREGCAASVRDAAIIEALPAARAIVERNLCRGQWSVRNPKRRRRLGLHDSPTFRASMIEKSLLEV